MTLTAFQPASVVLLSALAGAWAAAISSSNTGCLCTSDQPCWPSTETFAALASTLSQPLVYPHPTAWPCYPVSHPVGNCTDVNVNWSDALWRANRPGSLEFPNWEAFVFENGTLDACYLDTSVTHTCGQGRVPIIGVDARSIEDIQTTLRFAIEHNLKLVVKNTGHDFIGRSSAPNAFMLWTHNMKNISYDATFVPQGSPGNETFEALTVGAGVQWFEAYNAVHQHNRLMVGGVAPEGSIGAAGGWLAGGGHSFVSPSYGLGVDNVLEMSIVLSTGEYLVANAYQNSDIFWALRGGGGATYGIVISVTYLTYPEVPIQAFQFQANVTNSSVATALAEGWVRYTPELTDAGWGGYGSISNQGVSFTYFAENMTDETVTSSTQGWLNFTQSLTPHGVQFESQTATLPSWFELISEIQNGNGSEVGGYVLISSRLLSRESIANNASEVAQALTTYGAGFNTIAGGQVSRIDPDSVGLNPAWRRAVTEIVLGTSWDEETPVSEIETSIQQLREQIQVWHDTTPNDGVYLNEATQFEINWQEAFFGDHYARLKSIKDKYDPYRLFVVTEGVGSEEWNRNLTCRF